MWRMRRYGRNIRIPTGSCDGRPRGSQGEETVSPRHDFREGNQLMSICRYARVGAYEYAYSDVAYEGDRAFGV